jgi:hypothetical protein
MPKVSAVLKRHRDIAEKSLIKKASILLNMYLKGLAILEKRVEIFIHSPKKSFSRP